MGEVLTPARRTWWRRMLVGGGVSLIFVGAIAGGGLLHVGITPTRRIVAVVLSDVLSRTFSGRVVIERIDHIDADGFEGATATVYDPEGRRVLAVSGLRGRSSLVRIAQT